LLLWATQGIRGKRQEEYAYRVVPSAGCRHSFETYIAAINITGLKEGIYRYLPIEHALVLESEKTCLSDRIIQATLGQDFVGEAAAVFIWSSIPYRMEWRYGLAAHRVIAFDIGHVCQNLYLAVQLISAGTCAIAAYNQQLIDELLSLDGNNEFVIYLAAVGKI
jgi:SagB-type dehydrogenase family enzyme